MNKDQIKGRIKKAKGSVKDTTGELTGNDSLERKGELEKTAGKLQAGFGDIKADAKKHSK